MVIYLAYNYICRLYKQGLFWTKNHLEYINTFPTPSTLTLMAKNLKIMGHFFEKCEIFRNMVSYLSNSKCAGCQTKDTLELKSCKHIKLTPVIPDVDKNFGRCHMRVIY